MAQTQITLFPLPGLLHGDPPLRIWVDRSIFERWPQIRSWAAWQFECDEDDVGLIEAAFGGEYDDDDSRQCLTVRGEIVAVLDEPLSASEWEAVLTAAHQPSLIAQVREAARRRALVAAQ